MNELLVKAINASIKGGYAIMDVYASDFAIEHKDDKSPLTLADKNCNLQMCKSSNTDLFERWFVTKTG